MISQTEFDQLLAQSISGENETHVKVLAKLNQYYDTDPNNYIKSLLGTICQSRDLTIQNLAAILLRRKTQHTGKSVTFAVLVTDETITLYKQTMIQLFVAEGLPSPVRRQVTLCISTLGSILIKDKPHLWPDLLPTLFEWTKSPRLEIREDSLKIFSFIVNETPHYFTSNCANLAEMLMRALNDPESDTIKLISLSATSEMIKAAGTNKDLINFFKPLSAQSINLLLSLLQNGKYGHAIDALKSFLDILASRPSFFEDNLSQHLATLLQIINTCTGAVAASDKAEAAATGAAQGAAAASASTASPLILPYTTRSTLVSLREMAMETLVSLCVDFAKEIKAKPKRGETAFAVQFLGILAGLIPTFKPSPNWEMDEEEDDPDEIVDLCTSAVNRFAMAMGNKYMMNVAYNPIKSLILNPSWECRHAGYVLLFSIITENMAEGRSKSIKEIFQLALRPIFGADPSFASDPDAPVPSDVSDPVSRIVNDGLKVLFTLCKELGNDFIGKSRHAAIIRKAAVFVLRAPSTSQKLTICTQALLLLQELYEDGKKKVLSSDLASMLAVLGELLSSPHHDIRTSTMVVLSAIIDRVEDAITPFKDMLFTALMKYVSASNLQTEEDKELQARAIDCVSALLTAIGKEQSAPYLAPFTSCVLQRYSDIYATPSSSSTTSESLPSNAPAGSANPIHNSNDDFRVESIRTSWLRLAELLNGRFAPLLPHIIPAIIASALKKAPVVDKELNSAKSQNAQSSASTPFGGFQTSTFGQGDFNDDGDNNGEDDGMPDAENSLNDRETAIIYLSHFSRALGPYFAPYALQCIQIAIDALKDFRNQENIVTVTASADLFSNALSCFCPIIPTSPHHPNAEKGTQSSISSSANAAASSSGTESGSAAAALPPLPPIVSDPSWPHPVQLFVEALPVFVDVIQDETETIPDERLQVVQSLRDAVASICPLLNPSSIHYAQLFFPFGAESALSRPPASQVLNIELLVQFVKEQMIQCRKRREQFRQMSEGAEADESDDDEEEEESDEEEGGSAKKGVKEQSSTTADDKQQLQTGAIDSSLLGKSGKVQKGDDDFQAEMFATKESCCVGELMTIPTHLFKSLGAAFAPIYKSHLEPLLLQLVTPPSAQQAAMATPGGVGAGMQMGTDSKGADVLVNGARLESNDRVVGLFGMIDCIDFGGMASVNFIAQYMEIFLFYANTKDTLVQKEHTVRHNAVTGIGMCAEKGKLDPSFVTAFSPFLDRALVALRDVAEFDVSECDVLDEEDLSMEAVGMARDNAVASILKIIRFQQPAFSGREADLMKLKVYFVNQLPLLTDTDEAITAHDVLCQWIDAKDVCVFGNGDEAVKAKVLQILSQDPPSMLGAATSSQPAAYLTVDDSTPEGAVLSNLFSIFVQVVYLEVVSDETDVKFQQMLRIITNHLTAEFKSEYWDNLTETRQQELMELFTSSS
ncbi:putative Importin-5 [Monocercomonoides exilis]|uniref:putative Importin-5 n=1 Tax=Monocercomonoides exilis TaxID=2049356 RepID=UPI00355A1E88|nr:putative Importin-5 [Monocercomonoides exilis]